MNELPYMLTSKRLSIGKVFTNPNIRDLIESVMLMAQRSARIVVAGVAPAAMIDSSTGVAGAATVSVMTLTRAAAHAAGVADLASRSAFNTSLGKIDNAISVLGKYLNDSAFTALNTTDKVTLNLTGVVVTPGTIAAMDKVSTAVTGEADKATGTLTFTGQPANAETVTVGGKVYTFQTALTNVDGNVLIGASTAASVLNLWHAINATGGVAGTDYALATVANANVVGSAGAGTSVVVTAKVGGTAGNAIASTETVTNATWSGATLAGGAQDTAMLLSEAQAAITRQAANLSTVVKAYNHLAAGLGVNTIMDNTAGKADSTTLQGAGLTLYDKVQAGTTVLSTALATSATVAKADADTVLNSFANDVAYIAAQINGSLFAAATLSNKANVVLVP